MNEDFDMMGMDDEDFSDDEDNDSDDTESSNQEDSDEKENIKVAFSNIYDLDPQEINLNINQDFHLTFGFNPPLFNQRESKYFRLLATKEIGRAHV